MDTNFLDTLFPLQQGYVSPQSSRHLEQVLTIGGAPIGECLAGMMQLIRQQQQVIEELQSQLDHQNADQLHRIDRLERYVTLLTRDVKLDSRPIAAYGQGPMPTLLDSVATIEYRLTQVENKRRQTLLRQVTLVADRGRRLAAFQQWSLVTRAKNLLRDLSVGQARRIRQRYLQKWQRFLTVVKQDQVNKRRIRALNYLSTKNIVQRYYDKWRRFVDVAAEDKVRMRLEAAMRVEGLAGVSMRGVARRYMTKWIAFVGECRKMQFRVARVLSLEQTRSRDMARRYLTKWITHLKLTRLLRMRLAVVDQHSARAFRGLATRYFDSWKLCARRRIMRRQTRSVIPRMHHVQLVALARRYFSKLEMFSKHSADRREKEAMQLAIQQLARRCDALGAQLDIGLQTLSHTNGVLSKVLEHVSFNSSWERKRPSQSPTQTVADGAPASVASQSISRGPSAPPQSTPAAAARGAWGHIEDAWSPQMSADDLLMQLRTRLQHINDAPH